MREEYERTTTRRRRSLRAEVAPGVLGETEVFAREATGARQRVRSAAFPAHKTLEDCDFAAQPSAERPPVMDPAQLAWIEEHADVCSMDRLIAGTC